MSKALDIVLIQVRERMDVELQEQACFVERCGIEPDELRCYNVVRNPELPAQAILEADAVIIGGAGLFSATEDFPFTAPLTTLVEDICDRRLPLFGACYGHQFIARALGGRVQTDEDRAEIGTHEVELTVMGQDEALFTGMPQRFLTHMGHKDHVTALPAGAVELAHSPLSRNQAFRLRDLPVYGTQFHAELSTERLIERLWIYREIYAAGEGQFEDMKRKAQDTPHAERILSRWVELCLGRSGSAAG